MPRVAADMGHDDLEAAGAEYLDWLEFVAQCGTVDVAVDGACGLEGLQLG